MKQIRIVPFVLIIFLSCSNEQIDPDQVYSLNEKHIIENQKYSTCERNTMDIFLAQNRNDDTRTVIFIHGGGWKSGDKTDFTDFAAAIMDSGINAITINYRYANASEGISCYEILEDIGKSISYLKENKDKYGGSFNNITLFGASAGGHLALLYAFKSNSVSSVVSLAGPTDFNGDDILSINGMSELIDNLVGERNAAARNQASPYAYESAVLTHLYHGKLDTIVPYTQSQKLFDKIKTYNSGNQLTIYENCGHEFNDENVYTIFCETVQMIKGFEK